MHIKYNIQVYAVFSYMHVKILFMHDKTGKLYFTAQMEKRVLKKDKYSGWINVCSVSVGILS